MKNLTLSSWAQIAEIVSAIAVVLSLLYVGLEINQNTAAVKANTHQALNEYGRSQAQIILENPDLARTIAKGEFGLDPLTEEERNQFILFTTWRMANWEATFLSWKNDLVDKDLWDAYDGYFRQFMRKPGYRQFFIETKAQWHSEFYEHIGPETPFDPSQQ